MPLQPFRFPQDVDALVAVTVEAFQFPAHDSWNVPSNLRELLEPQIAAARRLWPLVRFAAFFQPALATILDGFLWLEDGQVVGGTSLTRPARSPHYEISNVGVLPAYRGRGIGRKLVTACIERARQQGAKFVSLSVIDENRLAIRLYEQLGFQHVGHSDELSYTPSYNEWLMPSFPLPYHLKRTGFGVWQPRFELAQRTTNSRANPPTPQDFQVPVMLRLLAPSFFRLAKMQFVNLTVFADSQPVGVVDLMVQIGGNSAKLSLDPAHDDIAPLLVQATIALSEDATPGQPLTLSLRQDWLTPLAVAEGFQRDFRYLRMQLAL